MLSAAMTSVLGVLLCGCLAAPPAAAEPDKLAEARALVAAKRHHDAVRAFEAANREAGGRCAACLVGEADARLTVGDFGGARKAATRAAELPGCEAALHAQAHLIVGFSLYRESPDDQRALRSAADAFRAALEASPDEPTARANLGLSLLKLGRDEEGVAELRAFLEKNPEAANAERIRLLIANPRRARDQFAPEFSLHTLQGEDVSLASLRGRVVVIDFWGTWCPPCRESVPEMKELVRRYADRVTVISISVGDPEERWKPFVESHGMTWPQCLDAEGALARRFGIHAFPTYLVIDGEGAIVQAMSGYDGHQSLQARLRRTLDSLLASR